MEKMEDMINITLESNSEPVNNVYYVKDEPSEERDDFISKDMEDTGSIFEPAVSILLPDAKDESYSDVEIECDVEVSEDSEWTLKDDLNQGRNFAKGEDNKAISGPGYGKNHSSGACSTKVQVYRLQDENRRDVNPIFNETNVRWKNNITENSFNQECDSLACYKCGNRFESEYELLDHLRDAHAQEGLFTCHWCDVVYSSHEQFRDHIRSHAENKRPYTCGACGKSFTLQQHYDNHLLSHKGFQCAWCDKIFKHKDHLKVHERFHTGDTPFSCSYCERKFTRQDCLIDHERAHTGEKPFPCDICEKKFKRKYNLSVHRRSHLNVKPYACNFCEKSFVRKEFLQKHIRAHFDQKIYACNLCDKRFSQKNSLVEHGRTHTGEKPFVCKVCGAKFARAGGMKRHVNIHRSNPSAKIPENACHVAIS